MKKVLNYSSLFRYDARYYKDGRLGLNMSCVEPSPYLTPVKEGTNEGLFHVITTLSQLSCVVVCQYLKFAYIHMYTSTVACISTIKVRSMNI